MFYFLLKDKVAEQLTPVFEQNTYESAARSLKRDNILMELVEDFDIAPIGVSDKDKYTPLIDVKWIPLADFVKSYGKVDSDARVSDSNS